MASNFIKVIGVLVLLLVAWGLIRGLEYYSEEVNLGWSEEASRKPYLAMDLYLQQHIEAMRSSVHLTQASLDDQLDALLIPNVNYVRLPSQQETILRWVENGGHLIVGIGSDDTPAMLADLGFSRDWDFVADAEEESDEDVDAEQKKYEEKSFGDLLREQNEKLRKQQAEQDVQSDEEEGDQIIPCAGFGTRCNSHIEPASAQLTRLVFDGVDGSLAINFTGANIIEHEYFYEAPEDANVIENPLGIEPFYWELDKHDRVRFAQTYYGEGMISILADFDIWHSANIGHFDHAFLLDILVNKRDSALLIYGRSMPSLEILLWENFSHALISGAILLAIFLFYYASRFGPIYQSVGSQRRSRSEQFAALSQFRWKIRDEQGLLAPIREDIMRRAARRNVHFSQWNQKQQHQFLAEQSQLPEETVIAIMTASTELNESRFTQTIQALQQLRNSL